LTGQPSDAQRHNGAARVLAVFRFLATVPEGATLKEITTGVDSPKTSVHRALAVLSSAGLASQDSVGRYRYSHDLFRLVFSCYEAIDEVARIRPVLSALAQQFGEATHYAILDGPDVVYLAKILSPAAGLKITSTVGGRNPAHCTGLGKVLLAYTLPDGDAVRRFVEENGPLLRRTDQTLVHGDELAAELSLTRKRGYALDREESEVGINCVALPLYLGPGTEPSGAISVTALARRMPVAALEQAVPTIRSIITTELGGVLA
jgi:IclR family transcriptional regulator, acetate operon repressor